eukprot:COSAG02_NODE_55405_length_290_cov_2.073298_1_plen_37_part_01
MHCCTQYVATSARWRRTVLLGGTLCPVVALDAIGGQR